ncbi:flagellar hook-basal body protein [Bacillus sp. RG28]|uniref:Flagellar hook-basal body protein n=1 Tax=Gottfriedia endophytica TaxID=2820819 RepID=A0A940NMY2_9BACI|nr:flagellar hook-basal body protein [Gottfriedia endophytica]MBP0725099.1 flagellar hook-basal body protein [Gottfriedia endophytica]
MLRGFYTAAAGMIAQQRVTEYLTNNLSNANTPGYKGEQASLRAFPEMLMQRMGVDDIPQSPNATQNGPNIGTLNNGVYMQETIPTFTQGDLQQTNKSTDIAIQERIMPFNTAAKTKGALFFAVQNEEGKQRYTRNGNFALDQQGYLTTNNGLYVLDENNKRIHVQSTDFKMLEDGTILENNQRVAKLKIAFSNNPYSLLKEGEGLFRTSNGQPLPNAPRNNQLSYTVNQGFLERSNVDVTSTYTNLMSAYRSFEANQKVVQAYDKSMDLAANDIGKLR